MIAYMVAYTWAHPITDEECGGLIGPLNSKAEADIMAGTVGGMLASITEDWSADVQEVDV